MLVPSGPENYICYCTVYLMILNLDLHGNHKSMDLILCVLLTALFIPSHGQTLCASNGFGSSDEGTPNTDSRNGRQYIFPTVVYDCYGVVTGLAFVAEYKSGARAYPEFQIWRNNGSFYTKRASFSPRTVNGTTDNNQIGRYEYQLNPAEVLPFQPGDIPGLYTPAGMGNPRSALEIQFGQSATDIALMNSNFYLESSTGPLDQVSLGQSAAASMSTEIPLVQVSIIEQAVPVTSSATSSISTLQSSSQATIESTSSVQRTMTSPNVTIRSSLSVAATSSAPTSRGMSASLSSQIGDRVSSFQSVRTASSLITPSTSVAPLASVSASARMSDSVSQSSQLGESQTPLSTMSPSATVQSSRVEESRSSSVQSVTVQSTSANTGASSLVSQDSRTQVVESTASVTSSFQSTAATSSSNMVTPLPSPSSSRVNVRESTSSTEAVQNITPTPSELSVPSIITRSAPPLPSSSVRDLPSVQTSVLSVSSRGTTSAAELESTLTIQSTMTLQTSPSSSAGFSTLSTSNVIQQTTTVTVPPASSRVERQSTGGVQLTTSSTFSSSVSLPGPTDSSQNSGSVLTTAVAAGVCGGVVLIVFVLLAVALIVYCRRTNKKGGYDVTSSTVMANPTYGNNNLVTGVPGQVNQLFALSDDNDYAEPDLDEKPSGLSPKDAKNNYDLLAPVPPVNETRFDSTYETPDLQWGIYVPTLKQRNTGTMLDLQSQTTEKTETKSPYSSIYDTLRATEARPVSEVFFEERDIYWAPSSNPEELYSQLSTHKYREIIRQQIQISGELGSGQFGTVHQGVWHSPRGPIDVAIKTLKEGAEEKDKVKFLQEAAISGQFHHPSIIKLQGVVTVGEPAMIVLELMPFGDLKSYLDTVRPLASRGDDPLPEMPEECLQFCRQVCSGMKYLSSKSFVHRDLAARNILLSKDKTCKIADFGMARDIEESDYYVSRGGLIPVKWTAPEALNYKKFSSASDVWSFGALMYEIWSLGHKPFENYRNPEVTRLVNDGFRLPPPPGCPEEVYTLMIKCWHPEASSRPTFTGLMVSLSQPDSKILRCPRDVDPPEAAMLGAPLEMGENLYPKLQKCYKDKDPDYDYADVY